MQDYKQFIESKLKNNINKGLSIQRNELNTNLFEFQKDIVLMALKKGKFAIFADTGLGKTMMQLEFAHQIVKNNDKSALILAPLAVSGQTIQEGKKFGYTVRKYNEYQTQGIYISNYEQLPNIDLSLFDCIVLDESSILKNFTGKIKQNIISSFRNYKYKLACTATPSPNDFNEIGNHSEFLNIKSRLEMLSEYFVHDSSKTQDWRLKNHAQKAFFQWINSWAIMITNPSDLGYNDKRYNLPALNYIEKSITTSNRDGVKLFNDTSVNAIQFNQELRNTINERMQITAEIVNNSQETFIVWINQNAEADILKKLIPDAIEVRGNETSESKESKLLGFANNEFRVLITKKKIAQFGLNFQNCNNQIFASLDFSFEGLYQAIRRSYRFGQKNEVNIYLITTDTMQNVHQSIKIKELKFNQMRELMKTEINTISRAEKSLQRQEIKNEHYHIINNDSIQEIKSIDSESVDMQIFSPPFADLYVYSDKIEDLGNVRDYDEFFTQFNYLTPELFRILKTGRICAVHATDLPILKGKEGYIGLRDFTGDLIRNFTANGFVYHSRITIWKDPVVEMTRTKALGLLHKQLKKDSSKSRVGIPDNILIFRKDGEPIEQIKQDINVDLWQKWASPIWYDIRQGNVLQYRDAKSENDEKHICPLQLDTIQRLIALYSNKNDIIFSPFAGIGSEGYEAIRLQRRFFGIELKESYYETMRKNLNKIVSQIENERLF